MRHLIVAGVTTLALLAMVPAANAAADDDWYTEASYANEMSYAAIVTPPPERGHHDPDPRPYFEGGFALLVRQLGSSVVGEPLEAEHAPPDAGADTVQRTSNGLLVWRQGERPSFTDGDKVYVLGSTPTASSTARATTVSPAASGPSTPMGSIWDTLATCESQNQWHINSGNSYYGGLQEDMTFWKTYGGLAYAPRPDLATRSQQIEVAKRGLAVQGFGAWPNCSRRLGLR